MRSTMLRILTFAVSLNGDEGLQFHFDGLSWTLFYITSRFFHILFFDGLFC